MASRNKTEVAEIDRLPLPLQFPDDKLPLPLQFPDDEDCDDNSVDDTFEFVVDPHHSLLKKFQTKSSVSPPDATLESLPPDASAVILGYLPIREICAFGAVSKAMYVASRNPDVWQHKFMARWNCSDLFLLDWFGAYQQAYLNPHDLWITHENIVYPSDGLVPGRCCVQPIARTKMRLRPPINSSSNCSVNACPSCRYHPAIHEHDLYNVTVETVAQAIRIATDLRIKDCCGLLPTRSYSPKVAEQAFAKASTFYRKLDTCQYHDTSLYFIKDLLFFQVNDDSHGDAKPVEREPHNSDVLHSWHTIRLRNPDYHRPVAWKVSIQRAECFTVFPSEGYLLPGESKVVTFGVKALASLMAHAFHELNIHRENADNVLARLYAEEGNLPYAPFLLHYHFTSIVPCLRSEDGHGHRHLLGHPASFVGNYAPSLGQSLPTRPDPNRGQQPQQFNLSDTSPQSSSPWRDSFQCDQSTKTFALSAHVHGDYPLSEFQRKTLVPFRFPSHPTPVRKIGYIRSHNIENGPDILCAPHLRESFPLEWERLQNLQRQHPCNDSVISQNLRSEGPCDDCGQTWGCRMEELGQAFVLGKLECDSICIRRRRTLHGLYRLILSSLNARKYQHFSTRRSTLLRSLRRRVVSYRGSVWLQPKQQRVLSQWEILLHLLLAEADSSFVKQHDGSARSNAIYKCRLSTDSVFDPDSSVEYEMEYEDRPSGRNFWREESPDFTPFANLTYNSGRLCLGHQQDQNHPLHDRVDHTCDLRSHCNATALVSDNVSFCCQAAICALIDPKSLSVHGGIFDHIHNPGTTFRRCKLSVLPRLSDQAKGWALKHQVSLRKFLSSNQIILYELQKSLDMESLLLVDSIVRGDKVSRPSSCYFSAKSFLRNIPPPGCGRFAFYQETCDEEDGNAGTDEERDVANFCFLHDCRTKISELCLVEQSEIRAVVGAENASRQVGVQAVARTNNRHFRDPRMLLLPGGQRIFGLPSVYLDRLGWTVHDKRCESNTYLSRSVSVAAQWAASAIMISPFFCSLLGRFLHWIPAQPVAYALEALPFEIESRSRYLTESECGFAAVIVVVFWMSILQSSETIAGHSAVEAKDTKSLTNIKLWRRKWREEASPLVLRYVSFLPAWNCQVRTSTQLTYSQSQNRNEHCRFFQAASGRGHDYVSHRGVASGNETATMCRRLLLLFGTSLLSFSAVSPHFFLNIICAYSSSIGLGLTVSIKSMEPDRRVAATRSLFSLLQAQELDTVALFGFYLGQLVGSSGGVLFLTEFVVTTIGLFLGGAGTISATAVESWCSFLLLSLTSLPIYHVARVAIIDSYYEKKCTQSLTLLQIFLAMIFATLCCILTCWQWDSVPQLVVSTSSKGVRQTLDEI